MKWHHITTVAVSHVIWKIHTCGDSIHERVCIHSRLDPQVHSLWSGLVIRSLAKQATAQSHHGAICTYEINVHTLQRVSFASLYELVCQIHRENMLPFEPRKETSQKSFSSYHCQSVWDIAFMYIEQEERWATWLKWKIGKQQYTKDAQQHHKGCN